MLVFIMKKEGFFIYNIIEFIDLFFYSFWVQAILGKVFPSSKVKQKIPLSFVVFMILNFIFFVFKFRTF